MPKTAPGCAAITAHLTVRDIDAAMTFYEKAFGFKRLFTLPGPGGKLMHGEMAYEGCKLMLGPESERTGVRAPATTNVKSPVTVYLYVENVDATTQHVKRLGGDIAVAPADMFFGDRTSVVTDLDGHQWMLAQHLKDVTPDDIKAAVSAMMGGGPKHIA